MFCLRFSISENLFIYASDFQFSRIKQYHSIPGGRSRECLWKDQGQRAAWWTAEALLPLGGVTDCRPLPFSSGLLPAGLLLSGHAI